MSGVLNLIKKKILPHPKRSIRFMLGWECYSLIGYLTRDRKSNSISGLTMDGLGLDPLKYDAPIGIHGTPDANPSYVDTLLEEIAKSYLTGKRNLPVWKLFPHFIVGDSLPSDPCFNIPMPYLYQPCSDIWHTSIDTPEKLMPESLKWSTVIGATYLYFLANAGYKEAVWLAGKVYEKYQRKLITIEENPYYQRDRTVQALNSVTRLLTDREKKRFKASLKNQLKEINIQTGKKEERIQEKSGGKKKTILNKKISFLEEKASQMIPDRLVPGVLTLETLPEEAKDKCKWGPGYQVLVGPMLWTNGKRNLLEIAGLLRQETNRKTDLRDLIDCYDFLEKYGYVRIRRRR